MGDAGEMSLGLESSKGFVGKVVQAVFGFVGTVAFARLLGPTSFGGFYLLLAIVFIANRPMIGTGQAVKKRYSEVDSAKPEILASALAINGSLVGVVVVLVFALRGPLVEFTGIAEAPVVFGVLLVSLGLFIPFQRMLSGQGWIGLEVWNDTLRSVLTLLFQLGFVLAGFGAAGLGYGLAAATLLAVPVAYYFLRVSPALPSRTTARSMWNYARYSVPLAFVNEVYDRFDVLLIGAFITAGAAAQYEVAFKLTLPALHITAVVTSGMMAKVSNLDSRGEKVGRDVSNAVAFVSILAIPLFFGALAIPEAVVVTIYGGEYEQAATLLVGLAFYQFVHTQTAVVQSTLAGIDLPNLNLRYDSVTLAANLVIGVALVEVYGALGVVVATIIAELARYAMSAYAVSRFVEEVDLFPRPLFEQILAGVVMFVVVEPLSWQVPVRSWVELVLLVGTGAVLYGVVLLVVSVQFRFTLRSIYEDAVS